MGEITNLKVYTKSYLDGIDQKKLLGSKCKKCGKEEVPAKIICTACQNLDLDLIELAPKGKIATFTCIGVGTSHFANKGYSIKKPYCVAIVELDNGQMITGQLVGGDIGYDSNQDPTINGKPIKVGAPVAAEFEESKDEKGNTHCRLTFKLE